MWWGHGFGWEWMFIGAFMMLLFWGGLIAAIIFAVRAFTGASSASKSGQASTGGKALSILKERYARGEIGKAELRRDAPRLGHLTWPVSQCRVSTKLKPCWPN
jgi:putative membrane protein